MQAAETVLALKTPIYEAQYGLDKSNPLKLYDCLVPQMEEHVKRKEMTYVEQMRYDQQKQRANEVKERTEIDMLKAENRILEAKCNIYIKEMEIVRWYINVMEGGVDASHAMKNYAKVRDECKALEK